MKKILFVLLMITAVALVLQSTVAVAGDSSTKETFMAFVNPTGQGTTAAKPLQIVIEKYTTDDEAAQYRSVLKTDGQDALMKQIRKNNMGFCRIGDQTGQQLLAARSVNLPDGTRKVTAIYGSVTGDFQVRAASKSGDFPFAFIEMIMKSDGTGDGMLVPAVGATVKPDGTLDLENFGMYPLRMMNLHMEGKK